VTPRTPLLIAAVVSAGLLSGCGDGEGSAGPAAVVNGIEISAQAVADELEAIGANTAYVEAYEQAAAGQGRPPIRGEEEGTFDTEFVRTTLGNRIQYAIVEAEVADRDLEVEDACSEAAREQLLGRFVGASGSEDGVDILEGFGEEYAGYLLDRETDFFTLQADLSGRPCGEAFSDDEVEAYFEANESTLAAETACVSHILVATEAEAEEIAGLLEGGADFATLAGERSTDTGSAAQGGELGCGPAGRYVEPFEAAVFAQPVGEVGDPVETEFGYHLILVTERSVPTLEELRPDIEAALEQEVQTAFLSWFEEALADGEVEVDPRYGTWDAAQAIIVAPDEGTEAEG
jgi:hypothetical protein